MPVLLFSISAGISLLLILAACIFNNIIGKISLFLSIPMTSLAVLFASYEWQKLEISMLIILSVLLFYLLASLVRISIDKRRGGEEASDDLKFLAIFAFLSDSFGALFSSAEKMQVAYAAYSKLLFLYVL